MLKSKIATLLQIRPEETRMVAWIGALFLLIQAGQGIGDTTAFAVFVSKNVEKLPYMYVPLGFLVFVISLGYTASLGRFQNASVVLWFLSGFAFLFLLEWVIIVLLQTAITQTFWLTVNGVNIALGTVMWTTAGEVCDARQAKRLFPVFASIGILGSIIGNSLTGVLAEWFGTDNLILICALLFGAALFVLRRITQLFFIPESFNMLAYNFADDLRAGYDFVRRSGLFRLAAYSAILLSVLFFTVAFVFSRSVAAQFSGDPVDLASFKGLFNSVTALFSFIISLVFANRLYARYGIMNIVFIMPITYLVGLVASYIFFGFDGVVSFRVTQQLILAGIVSTAWNAMFNVVPLERRGQVLTFMNGVPAQVGVMISGLLLIIGTRFLSPVQLLLLGMVIAVLCIYFMRQMRAEYGNALVSALQAGRVEVFSDEEVAFSGYSNDPDSLQIVIKALHDENPFTRRLAAEMLAKIGTPLAIPDLSDRLSDDDAGVRVAATKALADLDAKPALGKIILGLDDPDDTVREDTLASLIKLEAVSSPELIRTLERLLTDPNPRIGARAAVLLLHLHQPDRANEFLAGLLNDADWHKRSVALEAYREIAGNAKDTIPFDGGLIRQALNDPNPDVKRNALQAAAFFKDETMIEAVAQHLSDGEAFVRQTAAESLKQAWPESRGVILRVLNESEDIAASHALDAIPSGDVEILKPIRSYIQREAAGIQYWRMLIGSLPARGRMSKLLADMLRYRISLIEERLVQAVGLFGNPRAMELVRKGLSAGDAAARAAALEALETLGDKRITTEVLPILDRGGIFQADVEKKSSYEVAEIFISSDDRWLRAMGAYLVIESDIDELYVQVRKMMVQDRDNLVKDAAKNALSFLGGSVNMRTLKTLSTLDRVLLLREVPMFAGLSPDDLEKIAEIAEEQLFLDQALLCREGDPGHTLFIIASGIVDVLKRVEKNDIVLASRSKGEFVGEMAILESAPRSATLKARGGVRTLVIDGDAFNAIMHDRPQVAVAMLQHMSARVRMLNEKFGAS